ncbi:two-component sensor histidine kinase [Mycetocola tolaasinivorans]|uniref:Sensor-like histidine kinase SenX3 n=1 Tax=Mycetocola tolaasinivorans TaxID=76635 RepID=A0A3L7AB18_9MICO|nr:ATP-binding protein [Mycetocola tolaasinivorans]RLP77407.1 two-component sensor histidine kinase [Mycetocola tolaasinivorans]
MPSTLLVTSALVLGLVLGAGFTLLFFVAAQRGRRVAAVAAPRVPEGVSQVLDAIENAGVVVDPSGNVVKASNAAFTLGLVRDGQVTHEELNALASVVRDTGLPTTREFALRPEQFGELDRHVLARGARLGTRYVLILVEDQTERMRLDEVRRDFIANISHELKTPIGAIALLADALDPAADDPARVRSFAARLDVEAERLTKITADIINLSRLQSAEAIGKPALVNMAEVVRDAVEQNRVVAESHGVEVVSRTVPDAIVIGDKALLVVAVHNLVNNAIAYSPDATRVGVGLVARDGIIEVSVTDQGPGIAEEERERVFERFFRVDQARSRTTGGSGLGLSIVKHTAQNHGGEVRVWSRVGHGSTFTIRLPEAAPDARAQIETTSLEEK